MDVFFQAAGSASQVWRSALYQVGWHHGCMALAWLGTAWLCVLRGNALKTARQPHAVWHLAGVVLCLMGANTLLRTDLWATDFIRTLAKLQGWYSVRRSLQYLLVLVFALAAPVTFRWLHRAFARGTRGVAGLAVPLGLTTLLLVLALRMVSAHGTDSLLHSHLGAISVARLLELAGLGLVAWGAGLRVHNAATIFLP